MAQHDYILANQSGAAFRSDLNNGLAAIVSQNSGAAQPSTTYAYQWWADTTTGLLKIRNAANNAWITIGTLADANLGLLSLAGGTLTGALLVDDSGTAALPAIAFDGDPNTGIFRPAADQLGIATNGVERVEFGTTEVVFNDGGADVDFRVEGDTKPNLFKVDAGADAVSIDGNLSVTGSFDTASLNGGPLSGARNRIINGDMRIDQRNAGAVTVNSAYPVDRWILGYTTSGSVSAQYETASVPVGFQSAIKLTTTTADATTDATDQWNIQQWIEGFNAADLLFGTANAKTVTLSFWVRSSITGTFCATLLNYDGAAVNRSYVSEYTINVADTWEYKTITVPGDTSGTWLKGSDRGIGVRFGLTAGTSLQQTAGSWSTGNVVGSANQTQLLETLNATWYVTGVQLEPGTVATPFERRSYGQELALCQRYYIAETLSNIRYGRDVAIGKQSTVWVDFPVTMRVAPTTTQATTSSVGTQVASSTNNSITIRAATVANDMATLASYTASAEL
jgi:hypothetical protein